MTVFAFFHMTSSMFTLEIFEDQFYNA